MVCIITEFLFDLIFENYYNIQFYLYKINWYFNYSFQRIIKTIAIYMVYKLNILFGKMKIIFPLNLVLFSSGTFGIKFKVTKLLL